MQNALTSIATFAQLSKSAKRHASTIHIHATGMFQSNKLCNIPLQDEINNLFCIA